jgi:hypothetical protein
MATEAQLITAVKTVVTRFYPDFAPDGTATPYATYQQVGGDAENWLEGGVGSGRHARIQINVWSDTRLQANALMKQIEEVVKATPFFAHAMGALIARADPTTKLRGAQQDYSFWLTG